MPSQNSMLTYERHQPAHERRESGHETVEAERGGERPAGGRTVAGPRRAQRAGAVPRPCQHKFEKFYQIHYIYLSIYNIYIKIVKDIQ